MSAERTLHVEILAAVAPAGAASAGAAPAGGAPAGVAPAGAASAGAAPAGAALQESKVRRLCALAAASADVHCGHLAIELVGQQRIRELNAAHRGKDAATDVLSFPIDGAGAIDVAGAIDAAGTIDAAGAIDVADTDEAIEVAAIDGPPRELGDVVICPERTADLYEAIVHGVLHLVGLDHECDDGEMLALQAEILRWEALGQ